VPLIFPTLALLALTTARAQDVPPLLAAPDAPAAGTTAAGTAPEAVPTAGPERVTAVLEPLTRDRLFRTADIAIEVIDADDGDAVFSWRPDAALIPASVMKVLTTSAALRTLGPAYRFETRILHDGEIDAAGVLRGNLYIDGSGDPTLVVEKLWKMIRDLEVAGVKKIHGNVIFDDSRFDGLSDIVGWSKPIDVLEGPAYFAPLGALSVNYNTTALVIAPHPTAGAPARVVPETASDLITVVNHTRTGGPGSRTTLEINREVDEDGESFTFTAKGVVSQDEDLIRHYRAVADPTAHFVSVFRGLLKERGIKVTGRFREGGVPIAAAPLVSMLSPPLLEIVNHTNKYSSNLMAEHMLKTIGAEVHGEPGSTAKGVAVVEQYLVDLGFDRSEFSLVNGSGLSRSVKLRPSHINAVLVDMRANERLGPEFLASLSIGGVDGTLRRRYSEEAHIGRVRGKTGSVNGVYCLAGFVEAGDGERYAFTILANNLHRIRPVRALQSSFTEALLDMSNTEGSGLVLHAPGTLAEGVAP